MVPRAELFLKYNLEEVYNTIGIRSTYLPTYSNKKENNNLLHNSDAEYLKYSLKYQGLQILGDR